MKKIVLPGLLSGLAMVIIMVIVSFLMNLIFPGLAKQYENLGVFRSMKDPLMYLFFLAPFILGIILAAIWDKVKTVFNGTDFNKSLSFGMFYFLISIPGMIMSYSSFQISKWMVLSWLVSLLLQAIGGVFVIVKMNR